MSLNRFIYYCAVAGGWAAFLAWLPAELLFFRSGYMEATSQAAGTLVKLGRNLFQLTVTAGLVGAAVGGALNFVSGATNPQWKRQLQRMKWGLLAGGIGGAVGGFLGQLLDYPFQSWVTRSLGWILMGVGIGVAEGVYERSPERTRHGLIGGALGGLIGGLLFEPIAGAGTGMFSRAAAFAIMGLSVGAMIGLTHVVLKQAWLTVVDGFRPGRQLILDQAVVCLGRGDHLALPFLGYGDRDLESEHLKITRQANGQYVIEDNGSRTGTQLNGQAVQGPVVLRDGDLIRLGSNIVRFNHRRREAAEAHEATAPPAAGTMGRIAPPPPPPGPPAAALPATTPPPAPVSTGNGPRPAPGVPPVHVAPRPAPPAPPPPGSGPILPPPPPPPR